MMEKSMNPVNAHVSEEKKRQHAEDNTKPTCKRKEETLECNRTNGVRIVKRTALILRDGALEFFLRNAERTTAFQREDTAA